MATAALAILKRVPSTSPLAEFRILVALAVWILERLISEEA